MNQHKIQKYLNKNKKDNTFANELTSAEDKKEEINSNIIAVSSNTTFKDVAGIKEVKGELERDS